MSNFLKNRYAKLIIAAAIVVLGAIFMVLTVPRPIVKQETTPNANGNLPTTTENTNASATVNINAPKTVVKKPAAKPVLFTLKSTPHFISSSIANNATLTQMPATVTMTFNAPLTVSAQNTILVKKNDITSATRGLSYSDNDGKTLSVNLNQTVQSGDYYVYYVACFADTGCKDGRFGFHLKLPQ